MEIPHPFTACELKLYIMQHINESQEKYDIPLIKIAKDTHMETIEDLWDLIDPKNVNTSLHDLVELCHAVGLSIRISFD